MEHVIEFAGRHWMLCLALVAVAILIALNEWRAKRARAHEISTTAAIELLNHQDAVVLDLREPELFRAGHIVNATRANTDEITPERFGKYRQKSVILVCARGIQSSALAHTLRTSGFESVFALAGGMQAWQTASLPLVKGK